MRASQKLAAFREARARHENQYNLILGALGGGGRLRFVDSHFCRADDAAKRYPTAAVLRLARAGKVWISQRTLENGRCEIEARLIPARTSAALEAQLGEQAGEGRGDGQD